MGCVVSPPARHRDDRARSLAVDRPVILVPRMAGCDAWSPIPSRSASSLEPTVGQVGVCGARLSANAAPQRALPAHAASRLGTRSQPSARPRYISCSVVRPDRARRSARWRFAVPGRTPTRAAASATEPPAATNACGRAEIPARGASAADVNALMPSAWLPRSPVPLDEPVGRATPDEPRHRTEDQRVVEVQQEPRVLALALAGRVVRIQAVDRSPWGRRPERRHRDGATGRCRSGSRPRRSGRPRQARRG